MNKSLLSAIKYILLLAVGIGLLILAFRGQDLNKLLFDLKSANYYWVTASVGACLLAHIVRAARWNMLIKPLGYRPNLKNTFYAVMIGYLANLALPRMGEISRCGVLAKTDKIPVNQLIGTVISERIIDLFMLLFFTAFSIIVQSGKISGFINTHYLNSTPVFKNSSVLIFIFIILAVFTLTFYYFKRRKKAVLSGKLLTLWLGLKNGLMSIKYIESKYLFIFYSFGIWLLYLLSAWLCFFALSATSQLGFVAALAVLVFGSWGMTVPVQGGIGAYHWMVAEGLLIYGIEKTDGLAYATIIHSSQTLLALIVGSIGLILVMLNSPKKN